MNNVAPTDVVLLGTINSDGTITGVTTGTSVALKRGGSGVITFAFESVGTTSGGTILIEEARVNQSGSYSGTWGTMQSVAASDFTGTGQKLYHFPNTAYGSVRVRISSDVTGGGKVIVYAISQGAGS